MRSVSFRTVVEAARGGGHVVEVDPEIARRMLGWAGERKR